MRVSVVIAAYNEAGNIGLLIEETFAAVPVTALGEVIAVDDCSEDETGAEIKALLARYAALRYLRHGRRAGQSAALRTGVLAGRDSLIATMDGDGQNDPKDIARLLARLDASQGAPSMGAGLRGAPKGPPPRPSAPRLPHL